MSSLRLRLAFTQILIILGLSTVYCEIVTTTDVKGNCSCGGFPDIAPKTDAQPLISQTPGLVVNCDAEGMSTCKNLCLALATATKAKGPEVVCVRLKNADELKLSAFSRICEQPWEYTGMTADTPLCCNNSVPLVCPSQKEV